MEDATRNFAIFFEIAWKKRIKVGFETEYSVRDFMIGDNEDKKQLKVCDHRCWKSAEEEENSAVKI